MNSSIQIINPDPKEWEAYKNLRLRSLKEDPYAFGASYEEDINLPEEVWRENIKSTFAKNKLCFLFAKDGDNLVGMVRWPMRQKSWNTVDVSCVR